MSADFARLIREAQKPPAPMFVVCGYRDDGRSMGATTTYTRDAAGRVASWLIEAGCTSVYVKECSP